MGEWPPYGGSHRDYIERESLGKLTLSLYHRDEGSYSTVQLVLRTYSYGQHGSSSSYILRTRYRTTVCADIVDYYWTTYDVASYARRTDCFHIVVITTVPLLQYWIQSRYWSSTHHNNCLP
jgi:hypothetical protein